MNGMGNMMIDAALFWIVLLIRDCSSGRCLLLKLPYCL
jgi:hypothetical protein